MIHRRRCTHALVLLQVCSSCCDMFACELHKFVSLAISPDTGWHQAVQDRKSRHRPDKLWEHTYAVTNFLHLQLWHKLRQT
jgi:hypothetical protein